MKPIRLLLVALSVFSLYACSEDERRLSSWREDLVDLWTGPDGQVEKVVFDDNHAYEPVNTVMLSEPDTVRRVFAAVLLYDDGSMWLGNRKDVLTVEPIRTNSSAIVQDPLTVVAVWRGGAYVNMKLDLLTGPSDIGHRFAVWDRGVEANPNGGSLLRLDVYHDQNGDDAFYTRSIHFCASLRPYDELLQAGDSVAVSIRTATGLQSYRLPY